MNRFPDIKLYRVPILHRSALDGEHENTIVFVNAWTVQNAAYHATHDRAGNAIGHVVGLITEVVPPPDSGDVMDELHKNHRTTVIAIICGGLGGIILGLYFAMR